LANRSLQVPDSRGRKVHHSPMGPNLAEVKAVGSSQDRAGRSRVSPRGSLQARPRVQIPCLGHTCRVLAVFRSWVQHWGWAESLVQKLVLDCIEGRIQSGGIIVCRHNSVFSLFLFGGKTKNKARKYKGSTPVCCRNQTSPHGSYQEGHFWRAILVRL